MKHMKRTWRNLSSEQTLRYRQMSDTDRTRYEKMKRLLKEGIKEGMTCTCEDENAGMVARHAQPGDDSQVIITNITQGKRDHQNELGYSRGLIINTNLA